MAQSSNEMQYGTGMKSDEEQQRQYSISFDTDSIRRAFIQKVYSILFYQLLCFSTFIALCTYSFDMKEFMFEYMLTRWLWVPVFIIYFVIFLMLVCCADVARSTPTNYILLAIFTICSSLMLGMLVIFYDPEQVLIAAGLTAIVVLALTIFAMQTKFDFTLCGGLLFVMILLLIVLGFVTIFWPTHLLYTIYCSLGLLMFSLYLIYDTQLIMGDKSYALDPEDYIIAALMLYYDITQIFIYILQLLGDH